MTVISTNVRYNRGHHELLDYSSYQSNYASAYLWAKDKYSNAAVGQYIYIGETQVIVEGDENNLKGIAAGTYAKGPYIVDTIGETPILTPLSKSVAGEQDLSGIVNDLQSDVSKIKTDVSEKQDKIKPNNNEIFYKTRSGNLLSEETLSIRNNKLVSQLNNINGWHIAIYENDITTAGINNDELTEIFLPDTCQDFSFYSSTHLTKAYIPNNITAIPETAFEGTGLVDVNIPNNITAINSYAFLNSDVSNITLPNTLEYIGEQAFNTCKIRSITIPNSVTQFGDCAFGTCGQLKNVTIDGCEVLGYQMFDTCSNLESVIIKYGTRTIGDECFTNCKKLADITLPNTLTTIGANAFNGCSSLTSIIIPKNVSILHTGIFDGCDNLTNIYIKSITPPTIFDDTFNEDHIWSKSRRIYVPLESVEVYKNAAIWEDYREIIYGCVFEDENLLSGTNVKTINGESVLGNGNIELVTDLDDYYTKTETANKINEVINALEGGEEGSDIKQNVIVSVNTKSGSVSSVNVSVSDNLIAAIEKRHEHNNKDILDSINRDKINDWNAAQTNVIETIKVNDNKVNPNPDKSVNIVIPAATVTGVKSGDKVIALNGTELTATLSFTKETQSDGKNYLVIKGIDNNEIGKVDTSDFTADSFLSDVKLEGDTLKFTWDMADGTKKTTDVNIGKYIDTYHAGEGLALDSSTKTFNIEKVKTSITKTTEKIPVAGGPLAQLLNAAGITEINPDTDMQSLLLSLFCKELWPTETTFTDGSIKVQLAAPSFTLENSGNTVEVGTVCVLSAITQPSAATTEITAYPTVSGFDYGYSYEDDNVKDSDNTYVRAGINSDAKLTNDNYVLSIDYSKFGGESNVANASTNTSHTGISYASKNLVAEEGTNTVKATITGPKGTVSFNGIANYFACSNLGKTRKGTNPGDEIFHESASVDAKTYTTTASTNSKSLSVTGKYKYFIGYYSDKAFDDKTYSSNSIRTTDVGLSDWMNGKTINTNVNVPAGSKGMYIAIPSGIDDDGSSLTVKQSNANAFVQGEMIANKRTVTLNCGGTHTKTYVVFTWSFPSGITNNEPFEITSF